MKGWLNPFKGHYRSIYCIILAYLISLKFRFKTRFGLLTECWLGIGIGQNIQITCTASLHIYVFIALGYQWYGHMFLVHSPHGCNNLAHSWQWKFTRSNPWKLWSFTKSKGPGFSLAAPTKLRLKRLHKHFCIWYTETEFKKKYMEYTKYLTAFTQG